MPSLPAEELPDFVEPMLATPGEPFDGEDWLFEIKWDGFRSLAMTDRDGHRLIGRRKTSFTERFPELSPLARLPAGTVLDGEIVAMRAGKPDFTALLRRPTTSNRSKSQVVFVAFDLLYYDFTPILNLGCDRRRAQLAPLVSALGSPRVVMSQGVVGQGKAYFEQAVAVDLEGVVAKRRDSVYRPGRRTSDWIKIKRRQEMVCAVIGYEPSDAYGLRSLIIASTVDGQLQCVGKVGSGMTPTLLKRLLSKLTQEVRKSPAVPCTIKGVWVEPTLFVRVSYAEILETGKLRSPVLEEVIAF